jgi:hypothetical protein
MKFKEVERDYRLVCELTWGTVPVDYDWAIKTIIFKETAEKLKIETLFEYVDIKTIPKK